MTKQDIRDVVNDAAWQVLRAGLVGTWKQDPAYNVLILRAYLGDMSDPLKLRRVHNYLTGSVFRTRTVVHHTIDQLLSEVRKARGKE